MKNYIRGEEGGDISRRLMHDKMSLHWPRRDGNGVSIVGHIYNEEFGRMDVYEGSEGWLRTRPGEERGGSTA